MSAEPDFSDAIGPVENHSSPGAIGSAGPPADSFHVELVVPEPLPAELVFFSDDPPSPASSSSAGPVSTTWGEARPIGPGFSESIVWMIGGHIIQAVVAVGGAVALAILYFINHGLPDLNGSSPTTLMHDLVQVLEPNIAAILGLAGFATVLYGAAVVSLRFRRQGGLRGLGWRLPSAGHLALILMAALPLSLLCTELMKSMVTIAPGAGSELDEVLKHLADAPLWLALLSIAVAPALGEELIFRGLIGRGLISRMGVVRGLLLTSILFGVMHINPAQAVAVIPLGLAMHFVYLTTRSFWAPILVHFVNNALAVFMLKYEAQIPLARLLDGEGALPLHLLTVSAAMVTAIGLLFWQTRVQYVSADGTPLDTLWPVSDTMPAHGAAIEIRATPQPLLLACGAFNSLGFIAVLWRQALVF